MSLNLLYQRYPLPIFFCLTFVLSWGIWLPLVLLTGNTPSNGFYVLGFIGQLAPGFSALVVTAILEGKNGLFQLLKRFLVWRFSPLWYVFAISAGPVLYGMALGMASLLGIISGKIFWTGGLQPFVFLSFFLGAAARELGWRGFAQLRLQEKTSALNASLIVGILWACWYSFGYLWESPLMAASMPFFLMVMNTMAISILIATAFNSTQSSLLVATLFHGSLNVAANLLLQVAAMPSGLALLRTGMLVVAAVVTVIIFRRQNMTESVI